MGFAVPLVMMAGSAIASHYSQKSAQKAAAKRSAEEQAAMQGAQGSANFLQRGGEAAFGEGQARLGEAGSYWSRLLGGDRGAAAMATAGPRAQITDIYRGATRNLEHSGVRGASRDRATAELNRDRASQIAGLTAGVQPMAAGQLASVGGTQLNTGAQMPSQAGSIFTNLLGQGASNRQQAFTAGQNAGAAAGQQWGGFLYDMLSRGQSGRGGTLSSGNIGSTGSGSFGRNPVGLMPAVQSGYQSRGLY